MRNFGKLAGLAALVVILLQVSVAQPQGGAKGKGINNILGALGAKGSSDSITLLNNTAVRKELEVSDDQVAKIPTAAREAAGKILSDKQKKRLRQIELQQMGNNAYLDADVKKELKISDTQAKQIKAALDNQAKETQDFMAYGGFNLQALQEINTNADMAVQNVLSGSQKRAWTDLIGEPFTVPALGGLGGLGGFGK